MMPVLRYLLLWTALLSVSCGKMPQPEGVQWHAAGEIVSGDAGYDKGVSAMFAGVAGDALIVAGGANFPGIPAADGGRKSFYDHIYIYAGGRWHRAGTLPEPAAYGVGWTCGRGIVVAGGANENGALRSVCRIEPDDAGGVTVSELPPLPCATEQAAGAAIGERLYIVGGIAGGEPSAALHVLDTVEPEPQWRRLASAPEPFVQPVAAASRGRLYVWGGFDSAAKSVGGNGYCYDPQSDEWHPVAGHPEGGTFTGACAVTLADGCILCTGGVDREIFSAALRMPAAMSHDYLSQPAEAYRFQRAMRIFDPLSGEWSSAGEAKCTARAGASMAVAGGAVYLLGGELKPGIRTSENFYTEYFK